MWALHFLKAYPTVDVLALKFKVASHTMVDWVWRVIDHLLEGLDEVFSLSLTIMYTWLWMPPCALSKDQLFTQSRKPITQESTISIVRNGRLPFA